MVLLRILGDTGTILTILSMARVTNRKFSPHLLAPTASDLVKYGKQDTILAGFHSDLNFLFVSLALSAYSDIDSVVQNNPRPLTLPRFAYLGT
jgi:hypothetical protein